MFLHMHYFRYKYELYDISLRLRFVYSLQYYLFLVIKSIYIQLSEIRANMTLLFFVMIVILTVFEISEGHV
jgi:hypothetical protein